VFDFDAKLPINLTRDSLTGDLPFSKVLVEDIARDFLAKLLLLKVENPFEHDVVTCDFDIRFWHPMLARKSSFMNNLNMILFHREGFILNYKSFIKNSKGTCLKVFNISPLAERKSIRLEIKGIDFLSVGYVLDISHIKTLIKRLSSHWIGWTEGIDNLIKKSPNHLQKYIISCVDSRGVGMVIHDINLRFHEKESNFKPNF
jgi:hypothetical protein